MNPNFWKKSKKPILALAPMAGITDSAFRQLVKNFGCDIVYTEMVSADALYYDSKKTLEMLKFSVKEKPVVVQLFGKKPEMFSKAASIVTAAGFSGIDINFGCPARKVVAHGGGVTLMRDLKKSREIVKAVLAGTKLPVSAKIRTSIQKVNKKVTCFDFYRKISDLKVIAIMVHGRSYEQGFEGKPDYQTIREFKKKVKKNQIVLANGGINQPEDASTMLEKTDCDGVGLARGARIQPWLFQQIRDNMIKGTYKEFDLEQIKKTAIKHAVLMNKTKGDRGIIEMRKYLVWYFRGFPCASKMRKKFVSVNSLADIKAIFSS